MSGGPAVRDNCQALVVLLSPAAIHLLELLEKGHTSEVVLTRRTAGRIGIPADHAREVLRGLVVSGNAQARGSHGAAPQSYAAAENGRLRSLTDAAHRHIVSLRLGGDHAQADLLELALESAFDAASGDRDRSKRARRFIRSVEGRYFSELLQGRTLGQPFALLSLLRRVG